jgi:3-isopropylmalate dehydrogenase
MQKTIAVLPGDGIGPEVIEQAIAVLKAVGTEFGHQFDLKYALIGAAAIDATGNPLPDETLALLKTTDAILFGAIGLPKYDNDPNAKVRPEQGLLKMRKELGLFANIRPVKVYDNILHLSPFKPERIAGVDFVIYRELTGGIYFGKKSRSADGKKAKDTCEYSIKEIERIAHPAFKMAQQRDKRLTLVDKANVLETSRLWRDVVRKMEVQYPDVKVDYMLVDNAAMQIIQYPKHFDVVLTENMFGDIISDEASVISGSMGLLPSASVGAKTALFEPIHGSYPQATGLDIANPMATILSMAMMLDYLGMLAEANTVREAVDWAMANGIVTKDLNSEKHVGTKAVGSAIAGHIKNKSLV